jgi:hypothetical protein
MHIYIIDNYSMILQRPKVGIPVLESSGSNRPNCGYKQTNKQTNKQTQLLTEIRFSNAWKTPFFMLHFVTPYHPKKEV